MTQSTTLTTASAPASTSSGAALPLVALPQGELLTVNEKNIPTVRNALGPGVHFQPLRLDVENGDGAGHLRAGRDGAVALPHRCR